MLMHCYVVEFCIRFYGGHIETNKGRYCPYEDSAGHAVLFSTEFSTMVSLKFLCTLC